MLSLVHRARRFTRSLLLAAGVLLSMISTSHAEGAWWNPEWSERKKVTIDTSAKGYSLAEPIGTTTVLVRLLDANFPVGALDDGSDLRCVAEDNKTVLPHHIEKWDSLLNDALLWVKVPDLKPGASTVFWIYFANSKATREGEAKASYDADTTLIYHFAENGAPAVDSTANALTTDKPGPPAAGALIGAGLRLPAPTPITIPNGPALNWNAGGTMTWSAWVKPTALRANAVIFSRRDGGNSFVVGENAGIPYVEISSNGAKQITNVAAPLVVNVWKHFAVVANGGNITFYIDGTNVATLTAMLPALNGPATIGKDDVSAASFAGEIDEMQISKVARDIGAIKFAAISQSVTPDAGKLVNQGEAEAAGEGGEESELMKHLSLFKDISKDLTFDGVIVIFLCIILAVIGWGVGLQKFIYLNKINKSSALFLKRWESLSTDLTALDHEDETSAKSLGGSAGEQRIMRQSPLFHIYHIGAQEIQKRINESKDNFKGLSGRTIEAIRATLHGGHVREVQRLNGKLVFLTIGIAGGPYLGLLGTVIGVMITFAVIAQSGEVEINSIAPGIAGALLATVAGLAVAIPALFLYSYLSSKIKDAVNGMEVFIDEFIARIAEAYPTPNE